MDETVLLWDGRTHDRAKLLSRCPELVARAESSPVYRETLSVSDENKYGVIHIVLAFPLIFLVVASGFLRLLHQEDWGVLRHAFTQWGIVLGIWAISLLLHRCRGRSIETIELSNGIVLITRGAETESIQLADCAWQHGWTWNDADSGAWKNSRCLLLSSPKLMLHPKVALGINQADREVVNAFFEAAEILRKADADRWDFLPLVAFGLAGCTIGIFAGELLQWIFGVNVWTLPVIMLGPLVGMAWTMYFADHLIERRNDSRTA